MPLTFLLPTTNIIVPFSLTTLVMFLQDRYRSSKYDKAAFVIYFAKLFFQGSDIAADFLRYVIALITSAQT